MFGYIVPEKPEMKIKEYELFRAYYCGVCRSIGKRHGQLSRMSLNYDSTFLAVLLSAVGNEQVKALRKRCIAHPVEKRHIVCDSSIVDYASDINILLAYYNLEDKKRDDGNFVPKAAMLLLKRAFKKLRKQYSEKCSIMEARLNDLLQLEESGCASMDMAAEPFARLMEEVTAYGPLCTDEKHEKALRWVGYNLGKWIYLLDAYDDLEKDIKSGSYNPLVNQYKYDGQDICKFKQDIQGRVEFNLTYSLNEISRAFELLGPKINKGILENIIYMGMRRKTENILGIGSCNKVE
ncbi:MAG TPA: DUF5685 family protein [Clostridia bacterium]|nr:DUF5685 family protein [Clostridia bacterium]